MRIRIYFHDDEPDEYEVIAVELIEHPGTVTSATQDGTVIITSRDDHDAIPQEP